MKILIFAYACHPRKGSEDGLAWRWVIELSKVHRLVVITRANNVSACSEASGALGAPMRFVGVDLPDWILRWKRGRLGVEAYYRLWLLLAYIRARRLLSREEFDVAHHLSFMSAGFLYVGFLPIPSVAGPVGGLQEPPMLLQWDIGIDSSVVARWVRNRIRLISPLWRMAYRRIDHVIAANSDTRDRIQSAISRPISILLPGWTGIPPSATAHDDRIPEGGAPANGSRVNIVWTGRHVRWKGLELAIRALHRAVPFANDLGLDCHLLVTGDGPYRSRCERLARELGVAPRCNFVGWVDRDHFESIFRQANVFLFTSIHETTGMSLLDAMGMGVPSICLDVGGPRDMTTDASAVKVNADRMRLAVDRIAQAILGIAADDEARMKLSSGGHRYVSEEIGWGSRVEEMTSMYQSAISHANQGSALGGRT